MEHFIKDNVYYITVDGKEVFKLELVNEVPGNQVVISTENEIFAGPINLISFLPDTK